MKVSMVLLGIQMNLNIKYRDINVYCNIQSKLNDIKQKSTYNSHVGPNIQKMPDKK